MMSRRPIVRTTKTVKMMKTVRMRRRKLRIDSKASVKTQMMLRNTGVISSVRMKRQKFAIVLDVLELARTTSFVVVVVIKVSLKENQSTVISLTVFRLNREINVVVVTILAVHDRDSVTSHRTLTDSRDNKTMLLTVIRHMITRLDWEEIVH